MQFMHNNPIINYRNRLIFDYACWSGAAIIAWYFSTWASYPVITAMVGALGIVYLRWATKKYNAIKRAVLASIVQAEAMMEEIFRSMEESQNKDDTKPGGVFIFDQNGNKLEQDDERISPEIKSFLEEIKKAERLEDDDHPNS